MSKCPICCGKMGKGITTFTSDLGFGVVVVRQVPALVCDQCGESWLSDAISQDLERAVDHLRQKHATVEVLNWQGMERLAA